jgi:alpha-glucosidase
MVGEVFLSRVERVARFVGPELLHQSFNFPLLAAPLDAAVWRAIIEESLTAFEVAGAAPTWVLSNHDVIRHATRYGGGPEGVARAAAATLTVLGLPGAPYLYQGEELGLEQDEVPAQLRQDPVFLRTGGAQPGRDGCRTPLPWTSQRPGHGFTTGTPWLPIGPQAAARNVAAEPGTLQLYRHALALRRELRDQLPRVVEWLDLGPEVLGFRRGRLQVVLNTGAASVPLPEGRLLLASREVHATLPPGTAAWLEA